jgi:hypothetical protein
MSQYSLDTLTRETYLNKYEKQILNDFDSYYFDTYFKIGGGIKDKKQWRHAKRLANTLDTENCTLINYIQDKIEGLLECKKKNRTFSETIIQHNVITPTAIIDTIDECCDWKAIKW